MSAVRCFVALDLPAAVRGELVALQERLRALGVDLKWVAPAAMHLTLKFLGELPPATFAAVSERLAPPLGVEGPLHLAPRGLGAFPTARRPRVAWVGLEGDTAALARLALTLDARAEECGVPREARPFRAHLTLGRSRGPAGGPDLTAALEAEGDFAATAFEAREAVLYESRLGPGGPTYVARKTIPLT